MLAKLRNWIHHLLDPHCDKCEHEKLEMMVCESCETLKTQLAISNDEKRLLLQTITELAKPERVEVNSAPTNFQPILPRIMPWSVRKQTLEANDRAAAQRLRQVQEEQKVPEPKEEITLQELEEEVLAVEQAREGVNLGGQTNENDRG